MRKIIIINAKILHFLFIYFNIFIYIFIVEEILLLLFFFNLFLWIYNFCTRDYFNCE